MAFQFSLAALLRVRQSIEQQQESLVARDNQQVAALRRQIEDTQIAIAEISADDARELRTGARAAELHFNQVRRELLRQRRDMVKKELTAALQLQAQQRLAFQKARQEREVVDALRERQLEAFREKERRREQRRLDDLFLLRREFLRRLQAQQAKSTSRDF